MKSEYLNNYEIRMLDVTTANSGSVEESKSANLNQLHLIIYIPVFRNFYYFNNLT
jgi:hypothetical protein